MAVRITIKKSTNRILIYSLIASLLQRGKIRSTRRPLSFFDLTMQDEICRVASYLSRAYFSSSVHLGETSSTGLQLSFFLIRNPKDFFQPSRQPVPFKRLLLTQTPSNTSNFSGLGCSQMAFSIASRALTDRQFGIYS